MSSRRPKRLIEVCLPFQSQAQPLRLGGGAFAPAVDDIPSSVVPPFESRYLGPLARDAAPKTVPVKLHELVVLARTTFPRDKVELLAEFARSGVWPPNDLTPMQRYRLKQLSSSYKWRVRQLPLNRFQPRIMRRDDGEATGDDGANASDGNGDSDSASDSASASDSSDSDSSSSDSSSSDSDSSDTSTGSGGSRGDGDGVGGLDSRSVAAKPVGRAADGSRDTETEDVLFVRAASRSADALDAQGQRMGVRTWFEVVPRERVDDVLQSLWHVGGIQSLSAAKLYARVRELYAGISLNAVASFIRRQEAAQLAKSNLVADKILAPRLPTAVNDTWYSDLTFLSADIPVSAPSGGAPYIGFLSVLDSLSRFAWTVPVRDKSAATIAAAHEGVILAFGAPRVLVQDNAQENSGYTMGALAQRFNFQLRFTKPHVSQENAAERVHGTLKNLLRTAALELQPSDGKGKQLSLPPLLARITLQYNCTVNATTKLAPFTVFFGRPPPPSGPPQLIDKAAGGDDDDDEGGDDDDDEDGGDGGAVPAGPASRGTATGRGAAASGSAASGGPCWSRLQEPLQRAGGLHAAAYAAGQGGRSGGARAGCDGCG